MKRVKRSLSYLFVATLAMLFTSCTMKGYYTIDTSLVPNVLVGNADK